MYLAARPAITQSADDPKHDRYAKLPGDSLFVMIAGQNR